MKEIPIISGKMKACPPKPQRRRACLAKRREQYLQSVCQNSHVGGVPLATCLPAGEAGKVDVGNPDHFGKGEGGEFIIVIPI